MRRFLLPLCVALLLTSGAFAQAAANGTASLAKDEAEIRAAIKAQTDAWNSSDISSFMKAYEDSPDTTFIGKTLRKGYKPILERYQQNYSTREQMGTLTFSDLDVRLVASGCGKSEIALVTGKFHLDRAAHGEATKDDGIFSLVFRKGAHGWKIILDHTS